MLNYQKSKEKECDYQLKILIIGDSGVGKTCFLLSFTKDDIGSYFHPTLGIDFAMKTIEVSGKLLKLQIWDTAGQERYRTLTNNYYHGADGIIVVYDINSRKSFESVSTWIKNIEEKCSSNVIKILIGNKIDKNEREVYSEEGNSVAKKNNMFFFETSTKHKKNNINIFCFIAQTILVYKTHKNKDQYDNRKESIALSRNKSSKDDWYCCL